jgi:hypothetical protein
MKLFIHQWQPPNDASVAQSQPDGGNQRNVYSPAADTPNRVLQ